MLEVQKYLLSGKSLDDLTAEYAIKVTRHETLPLAILNYCQIDSPKTNRIVRECRGLTLDVRTYDVVARSFVRFFNWGEVHEEMSLFDFSDFYIQSKEDGSLVSIYYFDGEWRVNTRGSFASDQMQWQTFTWTEGICKALGVSELWHTTGLDPAYTYVCEFCSPWNKIVRRYEKPVMYLLTAVETSTGREMSLSEADKVAFEHTHFLRPEVYPFTSMEQIQTYLQKCGEEDPTFEGVVICDKNGQRWKIKNSTYLALHKMRGDGDNLFHPKYLLPFILAGEEAELLTYFPEVETEFYKLKCKVLEWQVETVGTWGEHHQLEDQKEFALAIKGKPFSSLLFNLRKEKGQTQTFNDLKAVWRNSSNILLKNL